MRITGLGLAENNSTTEVTQYRDFNIFRNTSRLRNTDETRLGMKDRKAIS